MCGHLTNQARGTFRSYGTPKILSARQSINILSLRDGSSLTMMFRVGPRLIVVIIVLCFCGLSALAQSLSASPQPAPAPDRTQSESAKTKTRDPIERSDEFKSKLTFGIYFTNGAAAYDLNLRHQFGRLTAWIAGFYYPGNSKLLRVGAQYDYRKAWFHIVPTVEVATSKAVTGSLYSELGAGKTFAIAGVSRTNLKAFFDLFWDPSESVQLGIGHKLSSYNRIQAYAIFDVRLHTGQQNTHFLWRHKLNANNGITFDGVFKSGHIDSGKFIRDTGIGVYYDRPKWFWKLYYDPHVNFSSHTMVRTGTGVKF